MKHRLRRGLQRHPYASIIAVLWVLPVVLAVAGYFLLPDDNWDTTCPQIGCGLPSNLDALFLGFWAVAFFLGPLGLVLLLVTAVIAASRRAEERRHR